MECPTCKAPLCRTSVSYLCCPNGHGKLIQEHEGRRSAERENMIFVNRFAAAWKLWVKHLAT